MRDGNEMKPIPGHKGYCATATGQIWSLEGRSKNPHLLSHRLDKDGYPTVRLIQRGRRVRRRVHVLVCKAFRGYRSTKKYLVRHLDGNRLNPHLSNLAWGNYSQNARDRQQHGRCVLTQNAKLYCEARVRKQKVKDIIHEASQQVDE